MFSDQPSFMHLKRAPGGFYGVPGEASGVPGEASGVPSEASGVPGEAFGVPGEASRHLGYLVRPQGGVSTRGLSSSSETLPHLLRTMQQHPTEREKE